MAALTWSDNWDRVRARLTAWWRRDGLALCITAPREKPRAAIPAPAANPDPRFRWTDPGYRLRAAEREMSLTYFGGESFPYFDTQMGPGNLATFIGSEPGYEEGTVWFNPCITDPDAAPALPVLPAERPLPRPDGDHRAGHGGKPRALSRGDP